MKRIDKETLAQAADRRETGLAEVAKHAGVSTASVSRVLNGSANVSEALRRRIERAQAELGYVPNGAARALSSRRTRTVGAVVPAIENGGFAVAIAALQQRLDKAGYTLLLASSGYDPETELREVTTLLTHGVDGLVLVGDQHDARLLPIIEKKAVPYVETWTLSLDRPSVGFDNIRAAGQIVDYLVGLGHVALGVLAGRTQHNDRAAARIVGIERALSRHGLQLAARVLVEHPYRILDGRMAMRTLVSAENRPTAVICGNDQLAFGAIIEAKALGFDVPGDISVTGFNDLDYAAHLEPPLTTLKIPADQIGAAAGDYILRRLQGDTVLPTSEVEVNLIVRGSTAPPPGSARGMRRPAKSL